MQTNTWTGYDLDTNRISEVKVTEPSYEVTGYGTLIFSVIF
jgi:hypothetical protein